LQIAVDALKLFAAVVVDGYPPQKGRGTAGLLNMLVDFGQHLVYFLLPALVQLGEGESL
jgi:hypothetical protein